MGPRPLFQETDLVEKRATGPSSEDAFPETLRGKNHWAVRSRVERRDKPWFQRVDIASIDPLELDGYADRIVYQTLPWIKFIAHSQHAEPVLAALYRADEKLGYFTGLLVKKFGFKILGSPFPGWNTPYMGFNLRPDVSRGVATEALVDFAFNQLRCHQSDGQAYGPRRLQQSRF